MGTVVDPRDQGVSRRRSTVVGTLLTVVAVADALMAVYVGIYHAGAENIAFGALWALNSWSAAIGARVMLRRS